MSDLMSLRGRRSLIRPALTSKTNDSFHSGRTRLASFLLILVFLFFFYGLYESSGQTVGRPDRYVLLAVASIILLITNRRLNLRYLTMSPLVWLILFCLSTLIGSRGNTEAIIRSLSYIGAAVFSIILIESTPPNRTLNLITMSLLIASTIVCGFSLAYLPAHPYTRLSGVLISPTIAYSNPNSLGTFAACLAIVSLHWFGARSSWLWLILLVMGVLAAFFSGSRTAFGAMIAAATFSAIIRPATLRRSIPVAISLGLLALTISAFRDMLPIVDVLVPRLDPTNVLQLDLAAIDEYRWYGVQNGLRTLEAYPFFGGGINQLGISQRYGDPAENGYISLLADTGLIGFGLFAMWVASTFYSLFVRYRNPEYLPVKSSIATALALLVLFLGNLVFEAYFRAIGNIVTMSMILISASSVAMRYTSLLSRHHAKPNQRFDL